MDERLMSENNFIVKQESDPNVIHNTDSNEYITPGNVSPINGEQHDSLDGAEQNFSLYPSNVE